MKLIIDSFGKLLVAAVASALIIVLVAGVLIPGVRGFVSDLFPSEKNYEDKAETASAPTLACTNSVVNLSAGSEVDIFENITAQSSENVDLIAQLKDDFAKSVSERRDVFVYKINDDNTNSLVSQIDPTGAGKWIVVYVLTDNSESDSLKVSYTIS